MAIPYQLLIVDDDLAMREMLGSLFREEGYAVQEAASSSEALERCRDTEFDAVLSDIKMPGKSGIELVCERVHSTTSRSLSSPMR